MEVAGAAMLSKEYTLIAIAHLSRRALATRRRKPDAAKAVGDDVSKTLSESTGSQGVRDR